MLLCMDSAIFGKQFLYFTFHDDKFCRCHEIPAAFCRKVLLVLFDYYGRPAIQYGYPVRKEKCFVNVVRNKKHCQIELSDNLLQPGCHAGSGDIIKSCKRLIQQQNPAGMQIGAQ